MTHYLGGATCEQTRATLALRPPTSLHNVATLLNSGNIVFEASEDDPAELLRRIEATLKESFGRAIPIILRTADALRALIDAEPFAGITVTPQTRLYVTLQGGSPAEWRAGALSIPYTSANGNVRVLREADGAICSVIILSPQQGTLDLMKLLEEAYGKNVTTRNWNTIGKVARRLW